MGVFVKGMNVPTNCHTCELFGVITLLNGLEMYGCKILSKEIPFVAGYKHPDCPIIYMNDPHNQANEVCSFCGKKGCYAKGLCLNCYNRKRRNGTSEYKQLKRRNSK